MLVDMNFVHVLLLHFVLPHQVHFWICTCSLVEGMLLTRGLPTMVVTFYDSITQSMYFGGLLHFEGCLTGKISSTYVNINDSTQ